ncbi:MAG: hypothetical protein N3A38_05350 [Planctomycetota bacterium]|nr:hypothetical protein [Planctomycetota bacterium]
MNSKRRAGARVSSGTVRLLALLGWLALIGGGAILAATAASPETCERAAGALRPYVGRPSLGLAGAGLVLLGLAAALSLARGARRSGIWVVSHPWGDTVIELAPIEAALERAAAEPEDVIDVRIRLRAAGGRDGPKVRGRMFLVLREQPSVAKRTAEIAEKVRTRFSEMLPEAGELTLFHQVRVRPDDRGTPVSVEGVEAEKERGEFWGPIYPVQHDEDSHGGI